MRLMARSGLRFTFVSSTQKTKKLNLLQQGIIPISIVAHGVINSSAEPFETTFIVPISYPYHLSYNGKSTFIIDLFPIIITLCDLLVCISFYSSSDVVYERS